MCVSVERDTGATRPGSGLGQKWFIPPSYGWRAGGSACGTPLLTPDPRAAPVLNHFPSAGVRDNAAHHLPGCLSSVVSAECVSQARCKPWMPPPGDAFQDGLSGTDFFQSNPDPMTGTNPVFQESPLFSHAGWKTEAVLKFKRDLRWQEVLIYLDISSREKQVHFHRHVLLSTSHHLYCLNSFPVFPVFRSTCFFRVGSGSPIYHVSSVAGRSICQYPNTTNMLLW